MLKKIKSLFGREEPNFTNEIGPGLQQFFTNLIGINDSVITKTTNPSRHPWIFASANMTALVASQAPFRVFKETEAVIANRRYEAKLKNLTYVPGIGEKRLAFQKYVDKTVNEKLLSKSLEISYDHPLNVLLNRPNKFQTKTQLFYTLISLIGFEGHCCLIKLDADGEPISVPGEIPAETYPVSSGYFRPVYSYDNENNRVTGRKGWQFKVPKWYPYRKKTTSDNEYLFFPEHSVAEFFRPDPFNPTKGISPLTPLAETLVSDFLVDEINRRLLQNGAVPSGMILARGSGLSSSQRQDIRDEWQQKHSGTKNAGSVLILENAEYKSLGLSPSEMASKDTLMWNREKELSVTNTPPSVLGITEFSNYATQLGQDRNFWDKNLIPMLRMIEEVFEFHFLKSYSDEYVGMFDLSGIEALRISLINQVRGAERLCGQALHLPPNIALKIMNLNIERYDGDDLNIALETYRDGKKDAKQALDNADKKPPVNLEQDPGKNPEETPADSAKSKGSRIQLKSSSRLIFDLTYEQLTPKVAQGYGGWLKDLGDMILKSDPISLSSGKAISFQKKEINIDLENLFPSYAELIAALQKRFEAYYVEALSAVSSGIAVSEGVSLSDLNFEALTKYSSAHQKLMLSKIVEGTKARLYEHLAEDLKNSNSLLEFRLKIQERLNLEETRSLNIARTFTSTLIRGLQHESYLSLGYTKFSWDDVRDEKVRETHLIFGDSGIHQKGFNYLSLVDKDGTLEYPGDIRGPIEELAGCRCTETPHK